MSAVQQVQCSVCQKEFSPTFGYQVQAGDTPRYYCSQPCRQKQALDDGVACSVCHTKFVPSLAVHIAHGPQGTTYFCGETCRGKTAANTDEPAQRPAKALAVLNQKGGTGKTTTSVSIAAGLARQGKRTLLVDIDPQGNVGASLGITASRTLYHVLHNGLSPAAVALNVRENLDIIAADASLAAAEIELARSPEKGRALKLEQCMRSLRGYDYVVLDCAPALSILNHNALAYAGDVLVPVSCDYLALVGVKQLLRTLRRVSEVTDRPVTVSGVLPTFYDVRNKVCAEVVGYLRKTFGARTLPPVRVNIKIAEAPSFKKTIFEHAIDSHGARDYTRVVEWLRTSRETETVTASRAA